jgi:hypothetical protein
VSASGPVRLYVAPAWTEGSLQNRARSIGNVVLGHRGDAPVASRAGNDARFADEAGQEVEVEVVPEKREVQAGVTDGLFGVPVHPSVGEGRIRCRSDEGDVHEVLDTRGDRAGDEAAVLGQALGRLGR